MLECTRRGKKIFRKSDIIIECLDFARLNGVAHQLRAF